MGHRLTCEYLWHCILSAMYWEISSMEEEYGEIERASKKKYGDSWTNVPFVPHMTSQNFKVQNILSILHRAGLLTNRDLTVINTDDDYKTYIGRRVFCAPKGIFDTSRETTKAAIICKREGTESVRGANILHQTPLYLTRQGIVRAQKIAHGDRCPLSREVYFTAKRNVESSAVQ